MVSRMHRLGSCQTYVVCSSPYLANSSESRQFSVVVSDMWSVISMVSVSVEACGVTR